MSEKIIKRSSNDPRPAGKTDWDRLDRMTDTEIEAAVASDPDAPPLVDTEWFERARLIDAANMEWIKLHLDRDVVAWFGKQDGEFHWLVGQALWEYARAHGADFNGPKTAAHAVPKSRDAA